MVTHVRGAASSNDAVELSGRRAEFRGALEAEIEAARRSSAASAVSLLDGRRIARAVSEYQYVFRVESALQLPEDSPADLIVDRRRLDAKLISVQGLSVTLSVVEDLGPRVAQARLQTDLTVLMKRLIERIEAIGDEENAAGDRLLDGPAVGERSAMGGRFVDPRRPLNVEQIEAIESVLGRDLTFVWGPPGTGKTQIIGQIGAELFERGSSLLLVSHTNAAVDQAIMRIGDALGEQALEEGAVLRVGTPRDRALASRGNLLLAYHRERLAAERMARLAEIEVCEAEITDAVAVTRRALEVAEWVDSYREDLRRIAAAAQQIADLERAATMTRREADRVAGAATRTRQVLDAARAHLVQADTQDAREQAAAQSTGARARAHWFVEEAARRLEALDEDADGGDQVEWPFAECDGDEHALLDGLRGCDAQLGEVAAARGRVAALAATLPIVTQIEPARARLDVLGSPGELQARVNLRSEAVDEAEAVLLAAREECDGALALLAKAESSGRLVRRVRGIPEPDEQRAVADTRAAEHELAARRFADARAALDEDQALFAEAMRLAERVAGHSELPRQEVLEAQLAESESVVREARVQAREAIERLRRSAESLEECRARDEERRQAALAEATEARSAFIRAYLERPEILAPRLETRIAAAEQAERVARDAAAALAAAEAPLLGELRHVAGVLGEWGILETAPVGLHPLADALAAAHARAAEEAKRLSVPAARARIAEAERELGELAGERRRIEEALADIDRELISRARVIAVTLTSAYLRDEIQGRTFDTVLLDEASMAPIPALWVAASRAERAVVAIGDPEQLPPICISDDELAQDWLGTDIFERSDVCDAAPGAALADHVVQLRTQHRMHPSISAIPNRLVYAGRLVDGPGVRDESDLREIYDAAWGGPDAPVVMVDTGPLDAWVTSVPRGRGSSRLNFLSATVCVDLASLLLHPDRTPHEPGDDARAIIVSPYRPHARLCGLLLDERGLRGEVEAGTAHSFQGSEAEVVIIDLVNDEPHWKVAMFMASRNESMRRLVNVALTRAKQRLVIVGDIDYVAHQGRKAFIGDLIRYLTSAGVPRVSARSVVPQGLAARAAAGSLLVYGRLEPEGDRLIVTGADFARQLPNDLATATERVVIYSPFITQTRLAVLEPHLKALRDRGVDVWVITKPVAERSQGDRGTYRLLEATLAGWGVRVVHKERMHEKVVFIDGEVVWEGSLNPLSFRDTEELMTRHAHAKVVAEYASTLRLDDLVGTYARGAGACPCCGSELVPAEGKDQPFYWVCATGRDCYSRDIDDEPPEDGVFRCRCGGDYAFGERAGVPVWKCRSDGRHWRKIRRGDLRLPKMVDLIPSGEQTKVAKKCGAPKQDSEYVSNPSLF